MRDIYLMGIGGTGMGAMAGLLKQKGHKVRGSDLNVYSPMKEKLEAWDISYKTPYDADNLKEKPDLVIIGNVIRKDNPESQYVINQDIPYDSFPHALKRLFLNDAIPLVVTGTHGKTTTASLIAHTIKSAGKDLGYLVGGIPLNYEESFLCPKTTGSPFVVEGDEYDTAFFDKGPKFMHYTPQFLLTTSIEYDHADIYPSLESIINAFSELYSTLSEKNVLIMNDEEENIKKALQNINLKSKIYSYGPNGDYQARDILYTENGLQYIIYFRQEKLGAINLPLYGEHNLKNSLGAYALLHQFGLSHLEIAKGFLSFLGVKRRLEILGRNDHITLIDDFAHHPTAIRETLKAVRQKYPRDKIWVIFEPRSATSCRKVFEKDFSKSFASANKVFIGPLARKLEDDNMLDTKNVAHLINELGGNAKAYDSFPEIFSDIENDSSKKVVIVMTNGDLMGYKDNLKTHFEKVPKNGL